MRITQSEGLRLHLVNRPSRVLLTKVSMTSSHDYQLDERMREGDMPIIEGIGKRRTLTEREQKRQEKKEMSTDCTAEECRNEEIPVEEQKADGEMKEKKLN